MIFKFIAFVAPALPLFLSIRSVVFRRPSRLSEGMKEFKKQLDFGVWIFLGLTGCVVAIALAKIVWTWLGSP